MFDDTGEQSLLVFLNLHLACVSPFEFTAFRGGVRKH
jgi:hypothetical protein